MNPEFSDSLQQDSHGQPPVVIGISGSASDSKSVTAMMTMVRALGAVPVLLANHEQRIGISGGLQQAIDYDLGMVDAVMVMGNNGDIDPASYGAAKHVKTNIEEDTARRDYESALIQEVFHRKMPLLGVCGGHQRINVLTGGTLHQHVAEMVGDDHHAQGDIPGFIPVQYVGLVKDLMLADIADNLDGLYTPTHQPLPKGVVMENSFHHQAIDKVGKGFRVSAISSDGVIEGIEADPLGAYRDQFVMGVQWHPEFGASTLAPKIIERVIREGQIYAQAHPKREDVAAGKSFSENLFSSMNKISHAEPDKALIGITHPSSMIEYITQRRQQHTACTVSMR